jgi:hypothetical protein
LTKAISQATPVLLRPRETQVVAYDVVIFPNLGEWDDPMKAIFCVVVNPLIWEFPLTIGRATARVLPYNHSSTSYFLIVMVVAGKKATGRYAESETRRPAPPNA